MCLVGLWAHIFVVAGFLISSFLKKWNRTYSVEFVRQCAQKAYLVGFLEKWNGTFSVEFMCQVTDVANCVLMRIVITRGREEALLSGTHNKLRSEL
jgi:hypothetical protein